MSADSTTRGRAWPRWTLMILAALVVLLLVAVALLPTLLSTQAGKRAILANLNGRIAGSVDAEAMRLTWFRGQSVTELRLFDPAGQQVLHAPRVEAPDLRLLGVAMGSQRIGRVHVDVAEARLTQQRDEPTNLQRALEPVEPPEPDVEPEPMRLDADANVQLRVRAERVSYEAPDVEPIELTDLHVNLDVLRLDDIALRVEGELTHGQRTGGIDIDLRLTDAFTEVGELQLEAAQLAGHARLDAFPLALADGLMRMDNRLVALLGETLDADFTADGRVDDLTASLTARSERFSAEMGIASEPEGLRARPDSRMTLELTPAAFAALAGEGQAPAALRQAVTINAELRELFIPRVGVELDLARATLDAAVTVDDVELDVPEHELLALRNARLSLTSQALGLRIEGELVGDAQVDDVTEPVRGSLAITNAMLEAEPMHVAAELTDLPIVLVDAVAQQQGRLVALVGETLTGRVSATHEHAEHRMSFNADVDAPHLTGPLVGSLQMQPRRLTARTPSPMTLTLTPQGYRALVGDEALPRLSLAEPTRVELSLHQLAVALRDEPLEDDEAPAMFAMIDPGSFELRATGVVDELRVDDALTRGRYELDRFSIDILAGDLRELLRIDVEAIINELLEPVRGQAGADAGTLHASATIGELFSDAGRYQGDRAAIEADATLESVPSSLLDAVMDLDGTLRAALGPRTSAAGRLDHRGGVGGSAELSLRADHATAELLARIDEANTLRLREDAVARLLVTPELSEALLTRLNPFINAEAGEEPVTLTLAADAFAAPLDDFAFANVQAAGWLDPGTLRLAQTDLTRRMFNALGAIGFSIGDRYDATFSPMSFSLAGGQLAYRDFNMAVDRLTLRFQGDVNLLEERYNLRMGIPGSALARIYRPLGDVIAADEQIELPITGTYDAPELNTGALAGQIADLATRAAARGVLERVLPGRRDREEPDDDEPEERPRERRDPLRDILDRF